MAAIKPDAHWRDSARIPRLFIFDYRLTFPVVFLLFFPSYIVLLITLCCLLFFYGLERWGFTPEVFLRWLRSYFLAGRYKTANPWWEQV